HAGGPARVLAAFPREQARFLRPALHAFPPEDLLALLARHGVQTEARPNGRVFPVGGPGSAHRVAGAFEAALREAGVDIRLGARVCALEGAAPRLESLRLEDGRRLGADRFILATGGASYPRTGTRGEMPGLLKALGVKVAPWFPALAPIPLRAPRPAWEGVPLRGGELVLRSGREGKVLARFQGDVLFTREGISGPAALELSQATEEARREGAAWLTYACAPHGEARLEAELLEAQRTNPHQGVRAWLGQWLPDRLCDPSLAGLPEGQRLKDLPREGRRALAALVGAFPLGEPGPVDLAKGEVAAGGVLLKEVDPRTMALKGWENLRVCGELLDVDGPVGGYNLQAAFSTGFAAGSD
ncbi:MAG TPA: aminoacetone oxidase family FAD-binding enzyme, partial [Holophaga sp.]|nr:aminoacetone oxidase family FAD-binding enzyme [Holophaga sp.]